MREPIANRQTKMWSSITLNDVLRKIRKGAPGLTVKRDYSAGTVLVFNSRREFLRALKTPRNWMVTFDSRLIQPKK